VAKRPEAPTNWAQARAQIDRGETGDKIAADDPAAAPLGTDAEAGGVSTSPADIARSVELQSHGEDARAAAQAPRTADRRQLVPWLVVILALAIAVTLALLIAG
jgi:CubicO group peptidase (beta-lactamase class C family)